MSMHEPEVQHLGLGDNPEDDMRAKGGGGVHVPFKTCCHSIAVCIPQGRIGAGILAHYVSIYMMHSMHLHQGQ